jgi:hypothetical protein
MFVLPAILFRLFVSKDEEEEELETYDGRPVPTAVMLQD